MLEAERERVAAASRRLAAQGLVIGSAGNVSERVDDLCLVTPTGARLADVAAHEMLVVDLEGRVIEGDGAPTSELALHLETYRRHDTRAVVHTHAPSATAVACVLPELPAVHYAMADLGGPVRVAAYATPGSEELAGLTVDALEGRTAVLMANHGTLTIGATLQSALSRAELLEWVSEVHLRAAAVGTPRALSAEQLEAVTAAARARARSAAPALGR